LPKAIEFDIKKLIKEWLPFGLYGLDEDGNFLSKSEGESSSEDELVLPPEYISHVELNKIKGGDQLETKAK